MAAMWAPRLRLTHFLAIDLQGQVMRTIMPQAVSSCVVQFAGGISL